MQTSEKSKSRILSLIAALVLGFTTLAQDEGKVRSQLNGGFGHFSGSYETVNLRPLNEILNSAGYPELPGSSLSFGGSGYFVIENILIGGGGASLSNTDIKNDSTTLSSTAGYGYLAAGYVFSTGKRSFLYPNFAVGAGGFSVKPGKSRSSQDLQEQLRTPHGRFDIGAGGLLFNLQLAWQQMIGTAGKAGWSVGLKAGYKWSPNDWRMHVNDNKATNTAGINMNGYYITLSLGGGMLGTSTQ